MIFVDKKTMKVVKIRGMAATATKIIINSWLKQIV